jgi:hypothetical protein
MLTHVKARPLWATIALLALVGAALLAFAPARTQAADGTSVGPLKLVGANEIPAVTTNAVGYFSGTLMKDSMSYDISGDGDDFTMAHIHMGAPGTNGPVVVFLFGPNTDGQRSFHSTGTFTVANLVGPLKDNWQGFVDAAAAGNLYVNAHSLTYPAGVIRIQLPPMRLAPPTSVATPAAPRTGTGLATADDNRSWMSYNLLGALLIGLAGGATLLVVTRSRHNS